jgi:hypothetical protein
MGQRAIGFLARRHGLREAAGAPENGGAQLDSAIPCSIIIARGPSSSAQRRHRSVHPLDTVARVAMSLRASLYGIFGQNEVLTNDEPRDQPARPETRPNQRLYVPLGSPPSVTVSSSTARAAHQSCAPQIHVKNDLDPAASKALAFNRVVHRSSYG